MHVGVGVFVFVCPGPNFLRSRATAQVVTWFVSLLLQDVWRSSQCTLWTASGHTGSGHLTGVAFLLLFALYRKTGCICKLHAVVYLLYSSDSLCIMPLASSSCRECARRSSLLFWTSLSALANSAQRTAGSFGQCILHMHLHIVFHTHKLQAPPGSRRHTVKHSFALRL